MPNPHTSETAASSELISSERPTSEAPDSTPSFGSLLSEFERSHTVKRVEGSREGTVVSVSADLVILDVGFKTEGILPLAELQKWIGKAS